VAVALSYSGNAEYGNDYDRAPGFKILAKNTTSISDRIGIRSDNKEEASEILNLSIVPNECAAAGSLGTINFSINDTAIPVNPTYELDEFDIYIYPDKTSDFVCVQPNIENYNVKITDQSGQVFKEYSNLSFSIIIDITQLPNGLHFIEIENNANDNLFVQRILKQ